MKLLHKNATKKPNISSKKKPLFHSFLWYVFRMMITGIISISSIVSYAQNRPSLKGKVFESFNNLPLTKATIAIVNKKDSVLIAYTLSDQNGTFTLHNLPITVPLTLIISYVAHQNYRQDIQLAVGQTLEIAPILLKIKEIGLSEIVIKGTRPPVTINRDTIEFAAEAFKVRPNAVTEELLTKLPGVQVNSDGTILVNGRSVSKILLNGKEYFSNDLRIASKNIDAAMIDKVQIYSDRENDPNNLLDESKLNKIINLKFKKAYKKSIFGKIYGGFGSDKRYETGTLLNSLKDTLQLSLIGFSNNLSRTAFTRDDLSSMGGFNRGGQDQISSGNVLLGGRLAEGIQKIASGGININNDYGAKLKINFLFFVNHTSDTYRRKALNQNFINDTTLLQNRLNNEDINQTNFNFSSLIQWKPSNSELVKYSPRFVTAHRSGDNNFFTNQYNNFSKNINRQIDTILTDSKPAQFDHVLTYNKQLNDKGESLTITHKLTVGTTNTSSFLNNNLYSFINKVANDTLHQLNKLDLNTFNASVDANFRHPFNSKWTGLVTYAASYISNESSINASKYNLNESSFNVALPDQTANFNRKTFNQTFKPGIKFQAGQSTSFQLELGSQRLSNKDALSSIPPSQNSSYYYFLPSLIFEFGKSTINYSESVIMPSINDLNPALNKLNSYIATAGNPYLNPARLRSLNYNYYKYNAERRLSLLLMATASTTANTIYYQNTIDSLGHQIITPSNGQRSYNTFIGGNLTKQFQEFKAFQISFRGNLYQGYSTNLLAVNDVKGILNYYYLIAGAEFRINFNNLFEITPRYEVNPSYSSYHYLPYPNVANLNQKLVVKYNLQLSKNLNLDGDYTRFYDSQIAAGFQKSFNLLNAALSFQFQKQRNSQLKLAAFDLLNENISIFRTVTGNSLSQGQNLIQRQYFLLTYQYKFVKSLNSKK